MIKCKYEGTGIWNGRCVGTKEVDPCPGYDKCKQYKPNYATNADRIRTMSDEELCNWLFKRDCTNIAAFLEYGGMGVMNAVQLLDWLQQPAEGE